VPTSLSFEIEWVDQPVASDVLERKSWASVRISVGHRVITRLYDSGLQGERGYIFVPTFALARWIVTNWWFLMYETAYSERLPNLAFPIPSHQRDWITRHSLRAADTGLLLPSMYLYSTGTEVCVHWVADPIDGFPHMPARFESSGHFMIDRSQALMSLQNVVDTILSRCSEINSPEADQLRFEWAALMQTTQEERDFCSAAARMGLDAYRADQIPTSLSALLEEYGGESENRPIVRDFFDSTQANEATSAWEKISTELKTRKYLVEKGRPLSHIHEFLPYRRGYAAARDLRKSLGLEEAKPIGAMGKFARAVNMRGLSFIDRQALSFNKIRAITGQNEEKTLLISGPKPGNKSDQRFLEARGIYHALYSGRGPRLITDAPTSEQQSARAFAAELLAPAAALTAYLDEHPDKEEFELIQKLAEKYNVNPTAIKLQLQNAPFNS
jgi:hypothetical protein